MKKIKYLFLIAILFLVAVSYANAQMHQIEMDIYVVYTNNSGTEVDLAAYLRSSTISLTKANNETFLIKVQGLITQTQEIQDLNITPVKGVNRIRVAVVLGPDFEHPYAVGSAVATIKKDYELSLTCKIDQIQFN